MGCQATKLELTRDYSWKPTSSPVVYHSGMLTYQLLLCGVRMHHLRRDPQEGPLNVDFLDKKEKWTSITWEHKVDSGVHVKQHRNKTDMLQGKRVTRVIEYSQQILKTDYTHNIITYGKMKYRQPLNLPIFLVKVMEERRKSNLISS